MLGKEHLSLAQVPVKFSFLRLGMYVKPLRVLEFFNFTRFEDVLIQWKSVP
jgi:hypothetical protein